jgi:catechol 2,3-dioxygenase-like lactoylglutathione lyase family enzyme
MLGNKNAVATIAVRDLPRAKRFYQEVLGLSSVGNEDNAEVAVFKSGSSTINVYHSQFAGTNQATALTWQVGDDLDKMVRDLNTKNVKFEHYDLPGMSVQGDIHVIGNLKTAWFKDPDGNILNLINQ